MKHVILLKSGIKNKNRTKFKKIKQPEKKIPASRKINQC